MSTTDKTHEETTSKLQSMTGPLLIIVRGLPGSGKSHLATTLQELIGKDKVVTLDPDTIDYSSKEYLDLCEALTTEGIEAKFYPNRFLKSKGYEAITSHKIIIWNQAFTNLGGFHRTIGSLETFASEHDIPLPVLVVEVEVAEAIARERVAKRVKQGGHEVSEEAFARFINDYVSFAGQGYDTVSVNGEDDVSLSISTVVKALEKLLNK